MSKQERQLRNIRLFLMLAGECDCDEDRAVEIQGILEQYDLGGSVMRAPIAYAVHWMMRREMDIEDQGMLLRCSMLIGTILARVINGDGIDDIGHELEIESLKPENKGQVDGLILYDDVLCTVYERLYEKTELIWEGI